jgi:hemoglobin
MTGKHARPRGRRPLATAALAALLLATAPMPAWPETARPPLYKRIGGYDFIAKFVDTAFPRVAVHPQLRRLFQGHSTASQLRQRQFIVDALCSSAGGPCVYVGRPMKPVHSGLGIDAADWATFLGILEATLGELAVPPPERKDFLGLLNERFRPDVVDRP